MLADRSGNVAALVAESKDAVEHKGVDWAAGDSDARYRLLAENLSDVIWTMDTNLKYTYISPSVTRLRGYSVEAAMALSMEETVTPASLETAMRVMAEAEAKQQSGPDGWPTAVTLEMELTCKNGSTVWVENKVTYLRASDGRLTGYLGVSRDISERRKAQAALVENEKRYRLLVENAGEGILVIQDGLVKFANRKTLDIFDDLGHAEQQVMSQPFTDFVHPEDRRAFVENSARCLAGEEHDRSCLFRVIGNGDEIRWLQLNGVHLEWEGKPGGLVFLTDITERRKAEEALRESEERLRILFECAPDAYYLSDMKATLLDGNRAAERLTGYKREELIGKNFLELGLLPAELVTKAAELLDRNILEQPTGPDEFVLNRRDGSQVNVEINTHSVVTNGHRLVLGIAHDITKRKQAEEALKTSEERFRTLIENASDAIAILDDKGTILYESPSAENIFGHEPKQLTGVSFPDLVHPDDIQRAASVFASVMESPGKIVDCQLRVKRKDGSWCEVEGTARNSLHDPKIKGIVVNYRDITERKKAQEAMREIESRYRLLAENTSDVITIMNMNMRPVYMSPSVTRLLGYSVEEGMAHRMEERLTPESLKIAAEAFGKVVAEEQKGQRQEPVSMDLEFRRKDGSTVWVATSMSFIRNSGGQAVEILSNLHDITERKRVEDATRRAAQHWRTTFDSISDLVSIHDRDFRMVRVNRSLSNLFKMEPKEVIGRHCYELFHGTNGPCSDCPSVKTMKTKMPATLEMFHDGFGIHLEITTSPIFNEMGDVTECVHIARDITERKKAEETLKESEERLKILFDYAPDLYCLSTPEGIVIDANRFALELFGYRREEIVGKTFLESGVVSLEQFEGGTASTTQRPGDALQMVLNRKDGTKVTVEIRTIPVTIKGQSLMLSIARDITERKRTEEQLRASDTRFKTLFESSMDATMLLAPEKGFLKGNPAAVEIFGCKDEAEFTTKTPADLSPEYQPDGRPSMAKAQEMIAIAVGKGSHSFEWTHKRVDGREFFADVLLARMEWEGQVVVQATVRDITERKKTEEALRESEERLRILFEYAPDAYTLSTLDGIVVDANRPACELTGYSREEVIGKTFIGMGVISLEQFEGAAATSVHRPDEPLELVLNRKDGTKVTAETKTFTVEVKGQTLLLSIARDITERKKAQEAIAESERHYRLLAENASDVITVMGMDMRPTYMSPSVKRLLGYSVEEAMANGMAEGLTPASSQAAAEALAKVLDEEQKGQKHEPMTMDLEFRRKDGSVVWVAASVSLIRNSDGRPVEILSNLHDISERKLIEDERERAKEEAETANRAKSDFLASMSHEIRTPMNGVVGMTGLLADTPLNPEQQDYVESIRSSAEALMTIINDILDFSKVEAGKLSLEKMDFDLRSTMENMSDVLAVRAREKGLEYVWLLEPNVPTRLVGDPGRLRQILINLVGNAVKFTPKGNVDLRISLVSESDTEAVIQFDVRDTGIGIPSDKIDKLFKPFTQVDTSTTRKYGGTGLGLSISKRMVELMGGQLGVESREGMGSTFWFTARLGKQSGERKSQELPLGMSGLRVLGVDDNPTNRKVLEHMLQAWGCRVEVVESAAIAMARLHGAVVSGDPFRVAVVDIMMPEVDGETLGRMVKATPQLKDTVLIASSSSGGRDDAARLGMVGFAHYLTKPVKQSQLFNAIASCVTLEGEKTTAATAAAAPSCTAVAETSPEQQKARILLAEDNAVNQKVAIAMLRKMGYSHVDVVASGAEALKALEEIPYDLVLMDVHMPEMDGLEATRRIRDAKSMVRNHLVPVVAMTASAMKGDREMCLDAGMNDYISKPINRAELVRALEHWASPQPAEKTSPPEAEAAPAGRVFDRPSLLERVGGDEEICAEILKTFLADVPERIREMEDALVRGDNETLKRGGHTIKGSAGNVGAPMLQEAAGRLEAAVAAGELGSAREKLDVISAEFEKFKKAVGVLLSESSEKLV